MNPCWLCICCDFQTWANMSTNKFSTAHSAGVRSVGLESFKLRETPESPKLGLPSFNIFLAFWASRHSITQLTPASRCMVLFITFVEFHEIGKGVQHGFNSILSHPIENFLVQLIIKSINWLNLKSIFVTDLIDFGFSGGHGTSPFLCSEIFRFNKCILIQGSENEPIWRIWGVIIYKNCKSR